MRLDLMLQGDTAAKDAVGPPTSAAIPNTNGDRAEFDQLLDTLYDATILTDFDGKIVTANIRAHDFFLIDANTFRQCNIAQFIDGANRDILEMVIQNIADSRFTLIQAYCMRSDQTTFPAEISVTAVVRNTQQCLCFSIRDITVRREVEEQLRIEGEAIRNAGDGIVITDTDCIITYTNPAVGRLWNYPPEEELLGRNIQSLFPASKGIEEALITVLQAGTWNGELEGEKTDQERIYLQTDITASRDDRESITHLVFSFADITRRRQGEIALLEYQDHLEELIRERTTDLESTNRELMREIEERRTVEEQLRDAITQLREHDKSKSIFVSNVSHELRTPLTSLINSLENLMRGIIGEVPQPVSSYFNMMLEDCWRLDRTINDILDLSRLEKGSFRLERRKIPFTRLMRRAAESMRLSANAIPIHFKILDDWASGYVDCDGAKIERVLINIVSNAFKFTPPDGRCEVIVHPITRADKPALACDVVDSGIGIPAEFIHRVTERFFRIGEQVEGTGLGLAIARETLEKHGGGIEIESPPPHAKQGTSVRIWLPKLPPPRILIVLQENHVTHDLIEALEQREYTTRCTSRGSEAVQYLRDEQIGVALIGAQLDDICGTETIMHIMADASLRHVKLFYVTAAPLDPSKAGLLQRFEIPHLMLHNKTTRILNQMEDTFLPISRVHSESHAVPKMVSG